MGCALQFQGHEVDAGKLNSIKIGVTTEQEILDRLGMPDSIVQKQTEGVRVYQYKDVTNIIYGIPFILTVGRGRQRGEVINIGTKAGRVAEIEHVYFTERTFTRSVENDSPSLKGMNQAK
jgi:hypothetical protein